MKKRTKIGIIVVVVIGIIFMYNHIAQTSYNPNHKQKLGVTFSQKFAKELGLDWKKVYTELLDDLGVRYIRLASYWDQIEPEEDVYSFDDLDWQIAEASARDAKIILTLGRRQPRWPECHDPAWAAELSKEEMRKKVLENIEIVVNRYKDNPAVEIWQIENEPFLDFFGECDVKITKADLQEEIDLVRSLDDRHIMITDSGELSSWYPAIKMGDIFGTTLYLRTWNKYLGYWNYFFIGPSWYRVRASLYKRPLETAYIAELQAEPWFPNDPTTTPIDEHYKTMTPEILKKNIEFARNTNFDRAYLWGVEWWYWISEHNNDSRFLDIIKSELTK